jgi:hypothetical protein
MEDDEHFDEEDNTNWLRWQQENRERVDMYRHRQEEGRDIWSGKMRRVKRKKGRPKGGKGV